MNPRHHDPESPQNSSPHRRAMLSCIKSQESAVARLIAFPHAGGSASAYREWELPAEFELWAVQPAGRGARFSEAAAPGLRELCDGIVEALRPTIDAGMPYAFFGHSFGCIVAVEVARTIADRALAPPLVLLLSAHPAPGLTLEASQASLSQSRTDEVRLLPGPPSPPPSTPCARVRPAPRSSRLQARSPLTPHPSPLPLAARRSPLTLTRGDRRSCSRACVSGTLPPRLSPKVEATPTSSPSPSLPYERTWQ